MPLYDNVADLTTGGYQSFMAFANTALAAAYNAVGGLQAFDFTPITLNVDPNFGGSAGTFAAPSRPSTDITPWVPPAEPADLDIDVPSIDDQGNAPAEPAGLSYNYNKPGGYPDAFDGIAPSGPPAFAEVTFPDSPSYNMPDVPVFFALDIPDAPTITIPTFDSTAPTVDFSPPVQNFSFTEVDYSSDLLTSLTARIAGFIQGDGLGLTAAIESALFDRLRTQEEANAARVVQEVSEEHTSRGWTEPDGVLANRLMQVRQGNQNAQNAMRRQVEIENKQAAREDLKHYVAQGIALEQILLSAHLAKEERRYQVARFGFEAQVQIFNSRVALFNALVQAYQADAQVFRERIQAAIAVAEVYKSQIEAQKAIGDVNKTLADAYESQVRGILAQVEIYRADVQARSAQIEANRTRIEAYRAEVAAYGELVNAYKVEWEAFAIQVQAELGNVQAAEVASRTYATRVGAWDTKWRVALERLRSEVSIEGLRVQKHAGDIQKYAALIDGERARVAASGQQVSANVQLYTADGQMAEAAARSADNSFTREIERGRAEADIALKNGEINLQAMIQAAQQMLEALKAIAQTTTQLSSSAMSAINISGSLSGNVSLSDNTSRSKSYSYSGETSTTSDPSF